MTNHKKTVKDDYTFREVSVGWQGDNDYVWNTPRGVPVSLQSRALCQCVVCLSSGEAACNGTTRCDWGRRVTSLWSCLQICDRGLWFFLFPKSCLNTLGIKAIKTFDHNNAPGKRAERNVQTYMRVRRSVKRRGSGVTWTFLVLNLDDKRCCFPDVVSTQFEIPVGAHDIQFIRTPI